MSRVPAMRTVLALLFVAPLVLAGCDSPEERAAKHLSRGQGLFENGELAKARLEFRNAIRLDGNNTAARFLLGQLQEEEGEIRAALGQYIEVADRDSDHLEVRIKLAQIYLAAGQLEEATRFAREAQALAPDSVEALATSAAVDYRLGDRAAARQTARKALTIDSDHVGANLIMIVSLVDDGRPDAALTEIDSLLSRIGSDEAVDLLRLRLVAAREDDDAVEAQLLKMAELYPSQSRYRRSLTQLYLQREDLAAAEAQLRLIAEEADGATEPHIDVVRFLLSTAGQDAARAELAALIEGSSGEDAVTYRLVLSDLETSAGNEAEARRILQQIVDDADGGAAANRALIQIARFDYVAGAVDRALASLNQVLEGDEGNTAALALRATIAIDRYDAQAAIDDLRVAIAADPRNPELLMLEARAHERNGNPTLMGERLAAATRVSEFRADVAMTYARHLLSRGEEAAAETVLSEAARRNARDRGLLTALAELRLRRSDLVGAAEVAEQLRALDADDSLADRVDAVILNREGRLAESISLLEQAAVGDEDNDNALAALIASYIQAGERDRAIGFLDDLLARNPGNERALILRAELHLMSGETAQAQTLLEQVIANSPEWPVGYSVLYRFHAQQGALDEAEAVVRSGLETLPDSQPLRLLLAEMLERRGAFDEAISEYQALYEVNPESLVVSNNLASLLAEFHEQDPEAIAFAQRVSRRLRGSIVPHFLDTYGWVQFLSGDNDEALRSLRPAAEGLPNNPLVRYHIGRVYAALGQADAARANLEAALAIDPNFPKAASARDTLAGLVNSGG